MAVCLLPGTEIAFSEAVPPPIPWLFALFSKATPHKTAIFRQLNKDVPHCHHDAVEFPDGRAMLLTNLREGCEATVLQLPAQPATAAEVESQRRAVYSG
jgi:hypothetical protein